MGRLTFACEAPLEKDATSTRVTSQQVDHDKFHEDDFLPQTMSLTDLITVIAPDKEDDPEDIFASAPGLIFTDDLRTMHGDDSSVLVYKSKRFGDIQLRTADPEKENDRKLFAHYLWNAGIKMAELVSDDGSRWSVRDERVLELGAGVGV